MKDLIDKLLLASPLMLLALSAIAQPPPPATPIDGGLGILLAGGAAYGLKKLNDHRKEKH